MTSQDEDKTPLAHVGVRSPEAAQDLTQIVTNRPFKDQCDSLEPGSASTIIKEHIRSPQLRGATRATPITEEFRKTDPGGSTTHIREEVSQFDPGGSITTQATYEAKTHTIRTPQVRGATKTTIEPGNPGQPGTWKVEQVGNVEAKPSS